VRSTNQVNLELLILCILEAAHWVIEGKEGAAALLGFSPSALRYRMQKLGIRRPRLGQ
jgi:formate hydrogenlyase transcriptional activator